MDFHGMDNKGKIWIEQLTTLPTWTSNDTGRLVYVSSDDTFYKATATEWQPFERDLGLWSGYVSPPIIEYNNSTSIILNTGTFHHKTESGDLEHIVNWSSPITFSFFNTGSNNSSSTAGAGDWRYLYIDSSKLSGETLTASTILDSVYRPSFDFQRNGWYGRAVGNTTTDDRCIFAVLSDGAGSIYKFYQQRDLVMWDQEFNQTESGITTNPADTEIAAYAPYGTEAIYATHFCHYTSQTVAWFYGRQGDNTSTTIENVIGFTSNRANKSINTVGRLPISPTTRKIQVRAGAADTRLRYTLRQMGYWMPYWRPGRIVG
jgi:hypothetical protein